jgi:hypothetical protein
MRWPAARFDGRNHAHRRRVPNMPAETAANPQQIRRGLPVAEFPNWAAILPASGALLPLAEDADFHWLRPSAVRGYFVHLAEVAEALPTRAFAGDAVAVYADVLRLDGALSMALSGLTLHARRIEVSAGAALALSAPQGAAPACDLKMFADEWAFEDPAQGMSVAVGGIGHRIEAGIAGGFAMQIDTQGDAQVREFADALAGDALAGQLHLNAAKRLARGPQVNETAALPLRIADWVARTGATPLLASDARAYAARLRTPRGNLNFVPYLQLQEYARLAQTTLEALQAVEDEARTLFGRGLDIDAQKKGGTGDAGPLSQRQDLFRSTAEAGRRRGRSCLCRDGAGANQDRRAQGHAGDQEEGAGRRHRGEAARA